MFLVNVLFVFLVDRHFVAVVDSRFVDLYIGLMIASLCFW